MSRGRHLTFFTYLGEQFSVASWENWCPSTKSNSWENGYSPKSQNDRVDRITPLFKSLHLSPPNLIFWNRSIIWWRKLNFLFWLFSVIEAFRVLELIMENHSSMSLMKAAVVIVFLHSTSSNSPFLAAHSNALGSFFNTIRSFSRCSIILFISIFPSFQIMLPLPVVYLHLTSWLPNLCSFVWHILRRFVDSQTSKEEKWMTSEQIY